MAKLLVGLNLKNKKWPYLSPRASNQKDKRTFFFSTLKVEKRKCLYFYALGPRG
jgi:hypothetical protein